MKRLFSFVLTLLLIGLVILVGAATYGWVWYSSYSDRTDMVVVAIPPGTGVHALTDLLVEAEVIDQPLLFKAAIVLSGSQSKLKAGEYEFPAQASPQTVLQKLIKGSTITHALTFPEGLTTAQMLTLVAQDPRLTGEIPEKVGEGRLMPDTYHFHRGDSRAAVVARMQKAMDEALAQAWESRTQDLPISTPEEALILASVVERETGVDDERPRVAAVFVNRLRLGMPLQSDPTVVYGIELAHGPMNRSLTRNDLKRDHAHNTYTRGGLPQGPIANPGKASIQATLNPPKTNELYFVATGTGGHHFATTLAEHNRNVARYRAIMRQQAQ